MSYIPVFMIGIFTYEFTFFEEIITDAPLLIASLIKFSPFNLLPLRKKCFFIHLLLVEVQK